MANMLIIDEDKRSVDILKQYLEKNNHNVTCAYSFEEGEACIKNAEFSIVFLDTNLPDCNGILLLREIIKLTRKPEIIIVTRNLNEIDTQEALANGVWDIFVKPFSLNHLSQTIESALDFWKQSNKVNIFRGIAKRTMLGSSAAMISCQEMAGIAAKNDVPVLIVGETGTGKELLANIIHQNSDRKKGRLVTIDCAALPQSLAESILFGNKKGAFTDAFNDREGLVTQAHEGTLFLDEIGELPLALQKTFLRVIQEKQFRPIGASREISSNFRLISATNRSLEEMVKSGKFRGDLYFRIQSLVIKPPTLNGRKQDIAELTASHIIKRCQMQKKMTQVMDPGFLQCLQRYSWPGNVRELFNVLDSCLAKASECSLLASKHLPVHIRMESSGFDNASGDIGNGQSMPILPELKAYRKFIASRAEKDYLQNLINVVEFDIERACQISGLSRSRFYELMKKYQLPIPRNAIIPRQNQTDLAPPLYVDSPQTKASFDSQTPE